jgi:hypothetical protein
MGAYYALLTRNLEEALQLCFRSMNEVTLKEEDRILLMHTGK